MRPSTWERWTLREKVLAGMLVVALLGLVGSLALGGLAFSAATTQRGQIAADEQKLAQLVYDGAVTQKASTKARVGTVTSRCELTGLIVDLNGAILGVLDRVHDRVDAPSFVAGGVRFRKSKRKCDGQLAVVKNIDANTPVPVPPRAAPKPKPKPKPRVAGGATGH